MNTTPGRRSFAPRFGEPAPVGGWVDPTFFVFSTKQEDKIDFFLDFVLACAADKSPEKQEEKKPVVKN
jgi:hypothetical protein